MDDKKQVCHSTFGFEPTASISTASNAFALTQVRSDLGSTAWKLIEPDAPGLFVLVYEAKTLTIPTAPETDQMSFALFDGSIDKPLGSIDLTGRPGLNQWYLDHVGHVPDKEPDGERDIAELIFNVAGHLMLRHAEEGLLPSQTSIDK
jgi:hypothetical protein